MKRYFTLVITCVALISFNSCQKAEENLEKTPDVSKETLAKIEKMGFSPDVVIKHNGGYIVEGDIFLTESELNDAHSHASTELRVAETEQYRTYNLVTGTRTITVSVSNLPAVYAEATNTAIARYNAQNLRITFQRVNSGGNINVVGFNEGPSGGYITLGSAGFPTSSGNPYNEIRMNVNEAAYGSNPDVNYLASVITHEIGHCIGFRHTDYYNRAYSCGGRKYNERSGSYGAVLIPGTPSTAQPDSWMLACSNGGNRLFNTYDIAALQYLY
jgi:hypothetical protein